MYFKQRDLFGALNRGFVKEIMKIAEKDSHKTGEMLFHQGDPASWFYILIKGRIKLSLGKTGQVVYLVSTAGEMFGWSSLVGRSIYSASAECMTATKLLRFDKKKLESIIQKDAESSVAFFKSLAAILGDRLIRSYTQNFSAAGDETHPSSGSGQVMDWAETEPVT